MSSSPFVATSHSRSDFTDPEFVLRVSYRRVTALQPTTHTAPASSNTTGPPSARCPITALRTQTCPNNKVHRQSLMFKLFDYHIILFSVMMCDEHTRIQTVYRD